VAIFGVAGNGSRRKIRLKRKRPAISEGASPDRGWSDAVGGAIAGHSIADGDDVGTSARAQSGENCQ
jgi:hypothetical protein